MASFIRPFLHGDHKHGYAFTIGRSVYTHTGVSCCDLWPLYPSPCSIKQNIHSGSVDTCPGNAA